MRGLNNIKRAFKNLAVLFVIYISWFCGVSKGSGEMGKECSMHGSEVILNS
jgi:hypothetical protein